MTTLQQGPGLMPRNWLADQLRGYGLNQLADRANSPTSGLGILADGVGGVANLLMQPVTSFQEMLANPYQRGGTDSRFVENAFDVAGGAMVGGLVAPRPKGSVGMSGRVTPAAEMPGSAAPNRLLGGSVEPTQPPSPQTLGGQPGTVRAYRGSSGEFDIQNFDPAASNPNWRTNEGALFFGSQDAANVYGAPQTKFDQDLLSSLYAKHTTSDGRLNVRAMNEEYAALAEPAGAASVMPADINTSNFGRANLAGYRWDSDEGARLKAAIDAAKSQGRDGLSITGMMDASGYRDPQYAVWGRGTVTSPLTGEVLYAGGPSGASVGTLNGLLSGFGYQQPAQPQPPADWTRNLRPGDI